MMSQWSFYSQKLRQRAAGIAAQVVPNAKVASATIGVVTARLGARSAEIVRRWACRAELNSTKRSDIRNGDTAEIERLKQENAQLREVNEILRAIVPPAPPAAKENVANYEAIDPLSREVLRKRIAELFPAGYLTLISIIQGVALGVLLGAVNQKVWTHAPTLDRVTAALQALAVLAAIVIITHRYFLLTALWRWRPTIVDTFLPYGLGIGEISAALLIGNNASWWIAVAVLFFAATACFAHTLIREAKPMFGDLDLLYATAQHAIKVQMINCIIFVIMSTAIALFAIYSKLLPSLFYVAAPCVVIIFILTAEIAGERDRSRAYAAYGFPGWRGQIAREIIEKSETGKPQS